MAVGLRVSPVAGGGIVLDDSLGLAYVGGGSSRFSYLRRHPPNAIVIASNVVAIPCVRDMRSLPVAGERCTMQATARAVQNVEEMSPTFDPASAFDDDLPGAVLRRASASDVDALLDLWRRARPSQRRPDRASIEALVQFGWYLVVENEADGILAAVHVRFHGRIGRVSMLTVAPHECRHGLATRLLGVADALCAVFGCTPYEELEAHAAA